MSYITELEGHELDALRQHLLEDFEAFSHFCFKIQTGARFMKVDYHSVMFKALQMIIDHRSTRIIINIPPRAGKTQLISIFLPLYAWCHSPYSQNILTGFNSDVLAECAGYIRTIMVDPDFVAVFPDVVIDMNKKSVERLGTMSGGVTHAVPTSGKLTGKGAGALVMDENGNISTDFAGMLCIDDVIKPSDAHSPAERNKINDRYGNTIVSRLNSVDTPLVIIMQRLHADDLSGFLMKGGSDDTFDWLNIPGIITKESGTQEWYDKQIEKYGYTNAKPILYTLPDREYDEDGESSFWAARKSLDSLKGMREKDPYTYYSQYAGEPVNKGKETVNYDDLRSYGVLDTNKVRSTFMTADTASTTETYSDFTVACHWGIMTNGDLYLLDVIVDKWSVPDLIVKIREFWKSKSKYDINAPTMCPSGFYIEDKSSGLYLNQQFAVDGTVSIKPLARDGTKSNDKFSRFLNAVPYFVQNRIFFPANHEHIGHIKREIVGQTEFGNTTGHDDFVDNVSDAVIIAFSQSKLNYGEWN